MPLWKYFIAGISFLVAGPILCCGAALPKVVLYKAGSGAHGMYQALKTRKDMKVEFIDKLSPASLFAHDVLIIGSLKGVSADEREAIRSYVECGGGAMLNHDACGYRGWTKPPFPEIVAKGLKNALSTTLKVKPPVHPVTKNMPVKYEHAYYDHITLQKGPKGKILVTDKDNKAVVIVGQVGHGKVVANGSITGYEYNAVETNEGEKAPEGGELQLLLNSIKWLSSARLTNLSRDELKKRQYAVQRKLALKPKNPKAASGTSGNSTDWFTESMFREAYLVRRPVNELGGKFFMFSSGAGLGPPAGINIHGYNRTQLNMRQLKWLGVTDIIVYDQSGKRVYHPSKVPGARNYYYSSGLKDPLMDTVKAAHHEGINVWVAWHSVNYPDNMCAKNEKGNFYLYGGKRKVEDYLNPKLYEYLHGLIDEYVEKYNKYGNFKGIFYDEPWWVPSCDFHGDDIPVFAKFCKERFGETPPDNIGKKFAKGRFWKDPKDKWWRRFILFKNKLMVDFYKDIVAYAHKRGLQFMGELFPPARSRTGWCWGMDNYNLHKIGADYYFAPPEDNCEPVYIYPEVTVGIHLYRSWGYYNTLAFRGNKAGTYFVFKSLWRPIGFGKNPRVVSASKLHICNSREWANSKSLTKAAILTNQMALIMSFADPSVQYNKELSLLNKLSYKQDMNMMLSRETVYYKNYKVLIAPPYSVKFLPEETIKALKKYLENGGIVISLNANFSSSRPDLTLEKDLNPEFTGVKYRNRKSVDIFKGISFANNRYPALKLKTFPSKTTEIVNPGVKVIATFKGTEEPAITELKIGKGKVIAFHYNVFDAISPEKSDTLNYLASLVYGCSSPAITAEGNLKIVTTLKKNNWVAVSLYAKEYEFPAEGVVKVDLKKLGLQAKAYRVMLLTRGRELPPEGDFWGKKYWTPNEIRRGIAITIPVDNLLDLKLPRGEKLDKYLAPFEKGKGKSDSKNSDADYARGAYVKWWDAPGRRLKRRYEHEILVIAPYNELTIDGEKTGDDEK